MDNGCRYYKDCFTCPFPECKFVGDADRAVATPELTEEQKQIEAEIKERKRQKALAYQREYQKKYYAEHKAERQEYQRKYVDANRQKIYALNNAWRKANRRKKAVLNG